MDEQDNTTKVDEFKINEFMNDLGFIWNDVYGWCISQEQATKFYLSHK